jgi:hypothetical protein
MHRLTARLLLTLLLVGVFVPVALAISAPAPHACCMRKPMHHHGAHDSEFNAPPACCNHDCCRPLTVSHWAQLRPPADAFVACLAANLPLPAKSVNLTTAVDASHSGRAPPQFSIA